MTLGLRREFDLLNIYFAGPDRVLIGLVGKPFSLATPTRTYF
jgi:hypothetical protein